MTDKNRDTLFFAADEALAAIRRDFRQYEPQIMLFRELLRLLYGDAMALSRKPGEDGIWLRTPEKRELKWLVGDKLVDYMCDVVGSAVEDLSLMAAVCARVFRTRAIVSDDPSGIVIKTDMERFSCRRCGRCCRDLDYHGAFTEEDYQQLELAGRDDILVRVGIYPHQKGTKRYRIWVRPGTRTLETDCPFLEHQSSRNQWRCRIHDVRPEICRQYPLSRKHAAMTGCPGFSDK